MSEENNKPVVYWNGGGAIIPADDVSFLPNWTDYYPIPLYTSAPTIPAGYVLVPVDPTSEMFDAAEVAFESGSEGIWHAMLAAATKQGDAA